MRPWINSGTREDVSRRLEKILSDVEPTIEARYSASTQAIIPDQRLSHLAEASYLSFLVAAQNLGVSTADPEFARSITLYEEGRKAPRPSDSSLLFSEASYILGKLVQEQTERQAALR